MAAGNTTTKATEQDAPKFQFVYSRRVQVFGPVGTQPRDMYEVTFVTQRGNSGVFRMELSDYQNDQKYLERLLEEGYQTDKAHYTPGLLVS